MKKYRKEKIEKLLKRELSNIIFKDLKDPRIKNMVNINEVELTADLKIAKIYVSIFGDAEESERKKEFEVLSSASNFLKFKLSKNLKLQYTPQLQLIYDTSVERGVRIIEKLERLKNEFNR
jgi:ribosome-binding factor A